MKKYFAFPTMLLILAASCNQKEVLLATEEEPQSRITEQPAASVVYIEAKGGETKASISGTDGSFTWNANDQIAVYAGGYKKSEALTSGGSASATFAFSGDNVFNDADRADFAIFPASLVFDGTSVRTNSATNHTSPNLTLTLPASYNLADVQDNKVPVPMIAANTAGGSLSFKNICALLRVTVNNVPKQTRRIEFDFGGKKVQGEFTLTGVTAGTTATVTSATTGTDDIITVLTPAFDTFGNLTINLPVPTGVADSQEYTDVVITSYDAASGGHKINSITTAVKASGPWAPGRTSARKLTAVLPVFTVADGKKVVFAPGNLQAVLGESLGIVSKTYGHSFWGASSWHFAANQYTFIGNTNTNKLSNPQADDVVDLFSWVGESKGYNDGKEYGIYVVSNSSGTNAGTGNTSGETKLADWGSNEIDSYPADTWRTLSEEDWNAVLNVADRTKYRFTKTILTISESPLTTVNGLIVLPDQYTHPLSSAFANVNRSSTTFAASSSISLSDLVLLEAAGCVFLPATGTRQFTSGERVIADTDLVVYWTSTSENPNSATSNYAMSLYVTESGCHSGYKRFRYYGCAVRLVRDVN